MKDDGSFPKWFPKGLKQVILNWYVGPGDGPASYRTSPMVMTNRILLAIFPPVLVFYALVSARYGERSTVSILRTLSATLAMYGATVFFFSRIHWYRSEKGFYTASRPDHHLPKQAFIIALALALTGAFFPITGITLILLLIIGASMAIF